MGFFRAIAKAIAQGLLLALKYVVGMAFVYGLGFVGLQAYLGKHPEQRQIYDQVKSQMGALLSGGGLSQLMTMVKMPETAATTVAEPAVLPALQPVADLFNQMPDSPKRTELLAQLSPRNAGADGSSALPLLDALLKSPIPVLNDAAARSLRLLGTPAALTLLAQKN